MKATSGTMKSSTSGWYRVVLFDAAGMPCGEMRFYKINKLVDWARRNGVELF